MIEILDIGIIGIGLIALVNLFKKKSEKRDQNTKVLLLIFFFFIILKLITR